MSNDQESVAEPRTVIHIEAAIGSSIFDFHIENADAIQLLGVAEALHAHGNVALAQMTSTTKRSPIEAIRGRMS
jgi:hypothetical protein